MSIHESEKNNDLSFLATNKKSRIGSKENIDIFGPPKVLTFQLYRYFKFIQT